MVFDDGHCFICGEWMEAGTQEHLFPKWLQRRFNLWDRSLTLLNGTDIRYGQLTVPCCARCNNEGLSQVEAAIAEATETGYEAVLALEPLVLFQWLAKILFGILYKEMGLLADRRDPEQGTIITSATLEDFDTLHALLQSIHMPFEFPAGRPFSILVARVHLFESEPFDFADNLDSGVAAMRLGEVGIVLSALDHGATEKTYGEYLADIGGRPLHAIQFEEVVAHTMYLRQRMQRSPKLITVAPKDGGGSVQMIPLPLAGLSALPVFAPPDPDVFRHFLWLFWERWGIPYHEFYQADVGIRSMMYDEAGDLLLLTAGMERAGSVPRGSGAG